MGLETQLRRGDAQLKLHREFGRDDKFQVARYRHEAIPAIIGIGTVTSTAHEGNLAVTKLIEMLQGKFGGTLLVKNDVGYAFDFAMTGYGNCRQTANALLKGRIDKNEPFDRAIQKETRILLDQIGLATMACSEIEVALFDEVLLHAAENLHGVAVIQFGNKHSDGERLAFAERARKETRPVVELGRGFNHAIASFLRDRADSGRIVQDQRDRGRREVEILSEGAQTDGLAGPRHGTRFRSLGHALML